MKMRRRFGIHARQMSGLRRLFIWLLLLVGYFGGVQDLIVRMRGIWSICIVDWARMGIRLLRRWGRWVMTVSFFIFLFLRPGFNFD